LNFILDNVEARVLGALVEKDVTIPDYYPLSLNALVNARNQKNNRDPAIDLDEEAVRRDSRRYFAPAELTSTPHTFSNNCAA
jgi:uncharacterized protein YceH (UPF0502 family)